MLNQHRGIKALTLATAVMLMAACGASTPTATPPTQAPVATVTPSNPSNPSNPPAATEAPVEPTATTAVVAPATPAIQKLNLNTATDEDFRTVPGVGNRMVREFLEYRPYLSIQQFRREIGKYVDAAQVAEYEKYVFVPIAPNEADAATLQQIPGVDPAIADALIAARPFADKAAFTAKLSTLVSAEQTVVGATYVEGQ